MTVRLTSPEQFPYPIDEHYEMPSNPHEQADEELRIYGTPSQLRAEVAALRLSYEKTPFMQSMLEFSRFAAVVRLPESGIGNENFNTDFYSGTLLALHVNIAPGSEELQKHVLRAELIPRIEGDADDDLLAQRFTDIIQEWAGKGERSWHEFYESQTKDYRKRAMALSQRLYEDKDDFAEREFDFMLGYTFATNLVWATGLSRQSNSPV